MPVTQERHRRLVARLTQQADEVQNASPAYRAELRRWTTAPRRRRRRCAEFGRSRTSTATRGTTCPCATSTPRGPARCRARTGSGADQTLVLLATYGDDPRSWLRSGEALQRVLLELTRLGWVASPLTQAIEVPVTRTRLRSALTWDAHPQMLLRIGRAEPTGPVPRTAAGRTR